MTTQTAVPPRWSARRWGHRSCLALALGFLLFAAAEFVSWQVDRARLRAVATAVAASARGETERLTRLTGWVYNNQGFRRNPRYHIWRKLRATPIQVLENGGHCADKSRLLVALLHELGIESSLAMLYPCEGCRPRHTVVLAATRSGWTLVDPVFNITFPDGRGGLRNVDVLRADRALLERRLAELRAERGPEDRINRYRRNSDHYALLTTVNWDKNGLTRSAAALICRRRAGCWSSPRPLFLDDPKQLFALLGFGGAAGFGLLALLVRPRR